MKLLVLLTLVALAQAQPGKLLIPIKWVEPNYFTTPPRSTGP